MRHAASALSFDAVERDFAAVDASGFLTALPRAPTLHRVALRGFDTLVLDTGGVGEPVLLLHSLGCDHRMWIPMLMRLGRRYRVLAPDLRFHGVAASAPLATSLDELANDALSVLDALGIARATICGVSMGGSVAQHLALAAPDRVAQLWLIACVARGFPAMIERAEAGERAGVQSQLPATLGRWFTPQAISLNGWGVRYARSAVAAMTSRDWAAAWRALASVSTFDRLGSITVPALLVAGSEDASVPVSVMQSMAAQIAGARLEILAGAPHMMPLESPERLAETLQPAVD